MMGIIYLYDEDGFVKRHKEYYSPEERKRIMQVWEKDKMNADYFQIYPVYKREKDEPEVKPLYSNIPVYDYSDRRNGHGH